MDEMGTEIYRVRSDFFVRVGTLPDFKVINTWHNFAPVGATTWVTTQVI